jgi:hypothetical protein
MYDENGTGAWRSALEMPRPVGLGGEEVKGNFLSLSFEGTRSLAWIVIAIAFAVVETRLAIGAELATGVLLYEQGSAGIFQYNIDVKDSGTTNIGTL